MSYSREYEYKLITKLREAGVDDTMILTELLCYFSSDDTCAALESVCDAFDVEY